MRSSRCDSGHCVEVLVEAEDVYVWDSKEPKVRLRFTVDEWEAFLHGAKLGEFDVPEQVSVDVGSMTTADLDLIEASTGGGIRSQDWVPSLEDES